MGLSLDAGPQILVGAGVRVNLNMKGGLEGGGWEDINVGAGGGLLFSAWGPGSGITLGHLTDADTFQCHLTAN